jgi:aldose 1-epimerase
MPLEIVTLTDAATASIARILVGYGFNCYQFRTSCGEQIVDVLWSVDGFETGQHRPSGSGIPILFPFPGRIQGTSLRWRGESYPLPEGDGRGNAIHGFVHSRPWRVLEQSPQHVVGRFQASVDDPSLQRHWPADFVITATYRLDGHRLGLHFRIANPNDVPLPCGLGIHPYFRIPIAGRGAAGDSQLTLPVTRRWILHEMNATGQTQRVDDSEGLRAGFALDDRRFDDVFGGLVARGDRFHAQIANPHNQVTIDLDFGQPFRECVVYTPDHRQAVCVEPYTCAPDPFRLQAEGHDAGLIELAPGASLESELSITVCGSAAANYELPLV